MKRLFLIFFLPFSLFAQQGNHKYFISFTDKNHTPYSVAAPQDFLSGRALARRAAFNIPVTDQDLPVDPAYIQSVEVVGARVLTKSRWFNGATIECDSSTLQQVLTLPFIANSRTVFRYGEEGFHKSMGTGFPPMAQSELRTAFIDYGNSLNQIHLMNGDFLHSTGFRGEGMLIAMIDDGFYGADQLPAFDSLRMRNGIIGTHDFVSGDDNVYDDDTHGLYTLSTIAAQLPGALVGTAPEASFLLLRSEDVNSEYIIEEYNWNAAAEFADSAGADMISSSLGYTTFGDSTFNHRYQDLDGNTTPVSIAADIAASKGILVVVSAGNSGNNSWHYISAPADADSVITVGAVDSAGNYVSFSSHGPSADGDIKPNVVAKGYDCVIADPFGGVVRGNGTSFACPVLAGAAACLWQSNPHASAQDVRRAIERSCNYFLTPTDTVGFGLPDFRVADFLLQAGDLDLPSGDDLVDIYPNPFTDHLQLRFYSVKPQNVTITCYDMLGKLVLKKKEFASGGYINTFDLPGENLGAGIYFIRLSGASSFIRKVVREN